MLVVLNDEIHPARDVVKTSTYRVQTFRSLDYGALGHVDGDGVHFYRAPLKAHMPDTPFAGREIGALPRVDIDLFLCRRRRRSGRGGGQGRRARPRLGRVRAGQPEPGAAGGVSAGGARSGIVVVQCSRRHRPRRAAPPPARDRHRRRRGFHAAKGAHPVDADADDDARHRRDPAGVSELLSGRVLHFVIPAQAGIHGSADGMAERWVPAFAGTTMGAVMLSNIADENCLGYAIAGGSAATACSARLLSTAVSNAVPRTKPPETRPATRRS